MKKLEINTPFGYLQHINTFVDQMYQNLCLSPVAKNADFLLVTLAERAYSNNYFQ